MSKAYLVMEYCNMSQKAPLSMEYFMRKKLKKRAAKPVIKKTIYEKHYLKGVEYINPNIDKLITRNRRTIEKIMKVIASNQTYTR